jgi:hypothetical protein
MGSFPEALRLIKYTQKVSQPKTDFPLSYNTFVLLNQP